MFRPLHSPSGLYQGHGFCFDHSALSRSPDTPLSGQLVSSCFVKSGGITGEGLSINSLSRSRHSNQSREVSPSSFSDVFLSRHDDRELDFEVFPDAGTSLETSIADRISVFRQQSVVCSRGLPLYEVTPVVVAGSVGFPGRVAFGHLDTLNSTRSVLVVRRLESSRRGLPRAPSTESSVLVRRFLSRLGGLSRRPVGLRSPVSRGTQDVHQLARTSCNSHVTISFS